MAAKATTVVAKVNGVFGKPMWRSWTAWGLVIYALGETLIMEMGSQGLMGAALAAKLAGYMDTIGIILAGAGIRRKL